MHVPMARRDLFEPLGDAVARGVRRRPRGAARTTPHVAGGLARNHTWLPCAPTARNTIGGRFQLVLLCH